MMLEWWDQNLTPGEFTFPYFGVDIDGVVDGDTVRITHFEVGGLDDQYNERGQGRGSFVLGHLLERAEANSSLTRVTIEIGDVDGRSRPFIEKFGFTVTDTSTRDGRPVLHAERSVKPDMEE